MTGPAILVILSEAKNLTTSEAKNLMAKQRIRL